MYFVPEQAGKVIQNLHRSLAKGGWLFVSSGEPSPALHSLFVIEKFADTLLYRKDTEKSRKIMDAVLTGPVYPHFPEEVEVPLQGDSPPLPVDFESYPKPEISLPVEPPKSLLPNDEPPKAAESPLSLYQEASALYEQGSYEKAIEKLLQAVSSRDGSSKAMMLLARAYANQGRLYDALAWCEKAAAGEKLNSGCHYLLATILQENGRMEEAAGSLRRALYLDPDFVLAHYALGILTRNQEKIRESTRHFKNALSLLDSYKPQQILPESDGMTAGRLKEIIQSTAFTVEPA
jgi:chemotaxis protein methyltransferase CheR